MIHSDLHRAKIMLLDCHPGALKEDFSEAETLTQTALYKHIYQHEYDTPGGEPFAAMISNAAYSLEDIDELRGIAQVAALAHCPFIGNIRADFFQQKDFSEVMAMEDISSHLQRAEYISWNQFRQTPQARYIGLTLPRFLLRLPYQKVGVTKAFQYYEDVSGMTSEKYCWGKASFALAANLVKSFKQYGWCVNIRGPQSGGKVTHLPLHQFMGCQGIQTKIPIDVVIDESKELSLAELGFIPLSYYQNSDFACFFSANSLQQAPSYDTAEATANSRVNARLPYIFLSSRLAHYLKVLQRENIGSGKSRAALEGELNRWLQTLVTRMNNPSPELSAKHPLRAGEVEVVSVADNPGYYQVNLHVEPHFQIEGMNVRLSLVAQLPTGQTN